MPQGTRTIAEELFSCCEKLQKVHIPEGVDTVAHCAFANTALTEIEFPSTVRFIGDCLPDCNELTSVTIKGKAKVSKYLFDSCPNLKVLNLPNGLESRELNLRYCRELEEINYCGVKIAVNDLVRQNFEHMLTFLNYAVRKNKFVPKNMVVLYRTNPFEIENFYAHAKDWQYVLNKYLKK